MTSDSLPAASAGPRQILIVDDDRLTANALARALGCHHLAVVIDDPHIAAALLTGGVTYDLILCGLTMPRMTGMELHRQLQRAVPAMAARLVFMTGGAFTSDAQAFVAAIPDRVLPKPVDPARVLALLAAQESGPETSDAGRRT
jgi:CheY-like chemotaxis protein